MSLLLVGLNHQTAPVQMRERLYLPSDTLKDVMRNLHIYAKNIDELAIISTCNRFEVYAAVEDIMQAKVEILDFMCEYFAISEQELVPTLYTHEGKDLIYHIMSVAAGLDSMVLGEAQILGQVSSALDDASQANTSGVYLHRLFEAAIHAGKRARTETKISQSTTSISHAAALLMHQKSAKLDPKVLILGAGEMAELAVFAIHRYGLREVIVLNRTFSRAQELATKFGVQAREWSRLWEEMRTADVVITATGAPHTILNIDDMRIINEKRNEELMLIDIAVPRDIAEDVNLLDGVTVYDIDSLQDIVDNSLAARKACIPQVVGIIEDEAERYQTWASERAMVPVIKEIREGVASVVQDELSQALNKMPNLSDEELEVIKRMTHRIMNKVLHAPTVNLRSRATDEDVESYTNIVRELFSVQEQ